MSPRSGVIHKGFCLACANTECLRRSFHSLGEFSRNPKGCSHPEIIPDELGTCGNLPYLYTPRGQTEGSPDPAIFVQSSLA